MKKTILIIAVTLILSVFVTIACTIEPVEAITTANFQSKGPNKPQYITLEEAQVLIDSAVQKAVADLQLGQTFFDGGDVNGNIIIDGKNNNLEFKNFGTISFNNTQFFEIDKTGFLHLTDYGYMRRESTVDPLTNSKFFEETSDRDFLVEVKNSGTGNGSRLFLDYNPGSSNFEMITTQPNALGGGTKGFRVNNKWFIPENLAVYETVAAAQAAGVVGWFKTSDGTMKTTK